MFFVESNGGALAAVAHKRAPHASRETRPADSHTTTTCLTQPLAFFFWIVLYGYTR